jgi:hypothetical protein
VGKESSFDDQMHIGCSVRDTAAAGADNVSWLVAYRMRNMAIIRLMIIMSKPTRRKRNDCCMEGDDIILCYVCLSLLAPSLITCPLSLSLGRADE